MDDQNIPGNQKNVVQGDIQNVKSVVIGDNNTTTNNYINIQNAAADKTFNMYLCRKLTEAISIYSEDANEFLSDSIDDADKDNWETQKRYRDVACDNIVSAFAAVVSKLLEKIFAIGKDASVSNNPADYIVACIATTTRTLQLLCFSFISKLWDYKKANNFKFSDDQLKILKKFLNAKIPFNIPGYIELLRTLVTVFNDQAITYPFSEFNKEYVEDENPFIKACNNLHDIECKSDTGQVVFSVAFEAEKELTAFLCTLNFLANYKMVSVKDIAYNDARNENVQYLHSYTLLGSKNNQVASKFKYDAKPVSNDAILIYKDNYQEGLNLFPFLVDVNALFNQPISRICFYTYFDQKKKNLTYTDIEKIISNESDDDDSSDDDAEVLIQFNDDVDEFLKKSPDPDVTSLFTDGAKFKNLQLNLVYNIFQNAQKEILG